MPEKQQLSASLEDYLETIFDIITANGAVRSKDIAQRLNVKAGSVTTALRSLKKTGHLNYKPYGTISLTAAGLEHARKVRGKHEILTNFFVDVLGADAAIAEAGACKIEHFIPDTLMKRLVAFTEFVQASPQSGDNRLKKFCEYYEKKQLHISDQDEESIAKTVNTVR